MIRLIFYFNSIKVRFELMVILLSFLSLIFQFHKGTIRTQGRKSDVYYKKEFQFHKGTIRTSFITHSCYTIIISIP